MKGILQNWGDLPHNQEISETYARLFPQRMVFGGSDERPGVAVQKDLLHAMSRLKEGDDREKLLGEVLTYTYVHGIRPHERVAERLNMSPATFYRHLKKGVEFLYDLLAREGK